MHEYCRDIDLDSSEAQVCSLKLFQDWYMRTAVSPSTIDAVAIVVGFYSTMIILEGVRGGNSNSVE
jgi:hypothetical protein